MDKVKNHGIQILTHPFCRRSAPPPPPSVAAKISFDFQEMDYKSAMKKLGRVALFYDPERAQSTRGFEGLLDPFAFKQQLQRCFSLHFNPKELGAIVDHFDKDKNGFIDGSEFLVGFYTLSQKEKRRERLKVKADSETRGVLLEKTVAKLRKKINSNKKLPRIKKPANWMPKNIDRVKTAAALDVSDDIRLGKLLSISMEETKSIYGRNPRPGKSRTRVLDPIPDPPRFHESPKDLEDPEEHDEPEEPKEPEETDEPAIPSPSADEKSLGSSYGSESFEAESSPPPPPKMVVSISEGSPSH